LEAGSKQRVAGSEQILIRGCWLFAIGCLLMAGTVQAGETEQMAAKRRQQGILTGMPFMANLAPRTFVDDLGRKIYLAKTPVRIVSLAPSVTEMLFAIGAGEQVVGVTQFCDYPLEAQTRPKVGYTHPNLESIIALQPDLVVASREFIRADVLGKFEQLKVPVFILEARTIEDVLSHIQTLGRMLDRGVAANQVAVDMRRRIDEIRVRLNGVSPLRSLYVINSQPLITVGPGSFIHQLIELAGGINIAAGATAPYPRLNMEAVIKEDPEVIVFPSGNAEGIPESDQQLWRRWNMLSAVRQERMYTISSNLLNRPGPRIVQGVEQLAKILHPEVFKADGGSR